MLLNIDLPKFDFPVIFDEHVSHPCALTNSMSERKSSLTLRIQFTQEYEAKANMSHHNFSGSAINSIPSLHNNGVAGSVVIVEDPEISRENPVEAKHRRLVRSHRNGPLDRELKPN